MDLVSTGTDFRYLLEFSVFLSFRFSQNTTPNPLDDLEVQVIDIVHYLKASVYNYMLTIHGHA